jgi:predicted glycogen debranching enzyme
MQFDLRDLKTPAGLHEQSHTTEWLLTSGQGGFAMGTVSGVPSRRYHGLLVASLRPPVNRLMTLSALAETYVEQGPGGIERRSDLSSFRFSGSTLHPRGVDFLTGFRKDHAVHFRYEIPANEAFAGAAITKSVVLVRQRPAVLVRYTIENRGKQPCRLTIRPLVAMRDFHSLQLRDLSANKYRTDPTPTGVSITVPNLQQAAAAGATGSTLLIESSEAGFTRDEQWWYNFFYEIEQARGYDALEDLYHPGAFDFLATPGTSEVTIRATLGTMPLDRFDEAVAEHDKHLKRLLAATHVTMGSAFGPQGRLAGHEVLKQLPKLIAAADDFVVQRVKPGALSGAPADRVTIIAGYPWFADWGRDSMISLPGLLLSCGRMTEALQVLRTFAGTVKDGLIPNVFDDYTGAAQYNTVDAPLWFVHAACSYLLASGDQRAFADELLPACTQILHAYADGTINNIGMDPEDHLIAAGDHTTQLTWMDAKRDGVVFTPRHGKPVEINALWHHALVTLAEVARPYDDELSFWCRQLAPRVAASMLRFWNPAKQCLHDVLPHRGEGPQGLMSEIRPNQLFAVSLGSCAFAASQQRSIVEVCMRELLTPLGVRTLAPGEPAYRGRFRGRMFERDAAYHNGTAWPWLLGPMAEALCRAHGFIDGSIAQARGILRPTIDALHNYCLGQVAEVYDGDHNAPDAMQQPGGCPAQAWSIAEVLRVSILLARMEAGRPG